MTERVRERERLSFRVWFADDRTIGEQLRDQPGWISSPDGGR